MSLEAADFSASQVEPIFFEGKRQETALREAMEVITLNGDQNQKLSGLSLNRDFSSNLAIIWLTGMFEDVNSLDLRYTGYQLAAANPENPVLVINIPAHGDSDALTRAQRTEIRRDRQLTLVAASLGSAARKQLPDTNAIVVAGQSAGGRLVPDFVYKAGELDFRPEALIGFNMAGVDKRPSTAMALAYLIDGNLLQYKYHQGADNQKLDHAMEVRFRDAMVKEGFRGNHNALMNVVRIYRKDPSYLPFILRNSPLADDSGFEAIERVMDAQPNLETALVSGGLDMVSRWRRIEPLAEKLVKKYADRSSWDVWPHDGHAMGIGPQIPRFAKAVRQVTESFVI